MTINIVIEKAGTNHREVLYNRKLTFEEAQILSSTDYLSIPFIEGERMGEAYKVLYRVSTLDTENLKTLHLFVTQNYEHPDF